MEIKALLSDASLLDVISNVDLLKLLDLTVMQVMRLREVSTTYRDTINSLDRFWKAAFPLRKKQTKDDNAYYKNVLTQAYGRYVYLHMSLHRQSVVQMRQKKTSLQGKIASRERAIRGLEYELKELNQAMAETEETERRAKDLVLTGEYELRDMGFNFRRDVFGPHQWHLKEQDARPKFKPNKKWK